MHVASFFICLGNNAISSQIPERIRVIQQIRLNL